MKKKSRSRAMTIGKRRKRHISQADPAFPDGLLGRRHSGARQDTVPLKRPRRTQPWPNREQILKDLAADAITAMHQQGMPLSERILATKEMNVMALENIIEKPRELEAAKKVTKSSHRPEDRIEVVRPQSPTSFYQRIGLELLKPGEDAQGAKSVTFYSEFRKGRSHLEPLRSSQYSTPKGKPVYAKVNAGTHANITPARAQAAKSLLSLMR